MFWDFLKCDINSAALGRWGMTCCIIFPQGGNRKNTGAWATLKARPYNFIPSYHRTRYKYIIVGKIRFTVNISLCQILLLLFPHFCQMWCSNLNSTSPPRPHTSPYVLTVLDWLTASQLQSSNGRMKWSNKPGRWWPFNHCLEMGMFQANFPSSATQCYSKESILSVKESPLEVING